MGIGGVRHNPGLQARQGEAAAGVGMVRRTADCE